MRLRSMVAGVGALALACTAFGAAPARAEDQGNLTVLASTDIHGHIYNWDYFKDAEYPARDAINPSTGGPSNSAQPLGMSRAATIAEQVRADRGADSVVMVDNGDFLQGTPLTYLAARQPDKLPSANVMAHAYNLMGYDAVNVGNHEFNYGLDYLNTVIGELNAPILGANVIDEATGRPYLPASTVVTKTVAGHQVRVGIVGVTTVGSAVWDKANLDGRVDFSDPVATASTEAGKLKAAGVDVVVVLAHMGQDQSTGAPIYADMMENLATSVATLASNVDLVVAGHSHRDIATTVVDGASGHQVLITQPSHWARSLAQVSIPLTFAADGTPTIDRNSISSWAVQKYSKDAAESPAWVNDPVLKQAHEATIAYVNSVVATSTEKMTTERSVVEDTPILDFIGQTQVDAVTAGIKGTPHEGTPVIAQVSPFSRTAEFPKGEVRIKDIAGLYIFDNTLAGIELTGAQVRDYLEYSAKYYKQVPEGSDIDPVRDTNAEFNGTTVWDYNYDALTGVTYEINISKPVGSRIENLSWQGKPLTDDQKFILAINNYRMNGGGGYPHVTTAPVVWNKIIEIRQLLIDTAQAKKVIDPATFYVKNWELVTKTKPVVTPEPTTPAPTPPAPTPPSPTAPAPTTPTPVKPALPDTGN